MRKRLLVGKMGTKTPNGICISSSSRLVGSPNVGRIIRSRSVVSPSLGSWSASRAALDTTCPAALRGCFFAMYTEGGACIFFVGASYVQSV